MNVMQKMKIDPTTVEGLARIVCISCREIPDINGEINKETGECALLENCDIDKSCPQCKAERLLAEVPMKKVKRWETYEGDFVKAEKEFSEICDEEWHHSTCAGCVLNYGNMPEDKRECFTVWLMDDVEVEA